MTEKKPRKPMSEEHKAKLREAALKRNAAGMLAKHREKAWDPAARAKREQNTKAAAFLTEELYPLLLKLDRAARDPKLMQIIAADPNMNARLREWGGELQVLFSRSAKDVRQKYGEKAYGIWQKLFVCIQPGGTDKRGNGFPSVWSTNNVAINDYLAEHAISEMKFHRAPTISEAVEMLMTHDALRRVWADWEIQLVKFDNGHERVEVRGKNTKVIAGAAERAELRKARKAVTVEAREAQAALNEARDLEAAL